MRYALVFLLILAPLAVAGQEADLEKARKHFDWMEYEKAESAAAKVLASDRAGPAEVLEAYRIMGLCQSVRGKSRQARETFLRLLALKPDFEFGDEVSPKLLGPFEQAKQTRGKIELLLRHSPPDAQGGLAGTALAVTIPTNPFALAEKVRLRWRPAGEENWQMQEQQVQKGGKFVFSLPAALAAAEIEYLFEALNSAGAVLKREPADQPGRLTAAAAASAPLSLAENNDAAAGASGQPFLPGEGRAGEEQQGEKATAWYRSWWFWSLVGAVVVGGLVGGAVAATRPAGGPADYQIIFR